MTGTTGGFVANERSKTKTVDPKRIRIVVAEDDSALREAIVDALTLDGYDVTGVADGEALVDCVTQANPPISLVLTDIHMPKRTGIEALIVARALPDHIPVVLITGDRDKVTHEMAHNLGAVGVLMKPFDGEDLRTIVAMLTATPDGWTASRRTKTSDLPPTS